MKHDEHRQLTFLFCDLVSSTAMARRLDAEDWRATLRAFQDACARVVAHHGGTVHDSPGDGLLAYFGFPARREHSAVDAVRAALDIAGGGDTHFAEPNRVLELARLEPLRVRVGVHTGPVVMGRVDGRITATGLALHFAERLHGHADPDTVLVSEATRHLIGDRFDLAELEPKTLKGFEEPAPCFRVERENARQTPFGTPFVGREAELALLERAWAAVRDGPPEAVLISGEAGIGKSRLIRRFGDGPCSEGAKVVRWYGAEDTRHSSLHPIVEHLRHALPDPVEDESGHAVAALESLVPASADRERLVPVMASLLSVPLGSRYPPLAGTASGLRERVHAALADWLVHESRERPLLLVLEDVRWIDPSTLEVVERIVRDASTGPMLLLMSCRTETSETWSCPFAARLVTLGRLPSGDAQALIRSSPGAGELAEPVIRQVIERSDGVPLFIEESTAMAIDASVAAPDTDGPSPGPDDVPAVPLRLTDLLIERLDRVGDARESAGVAAAIGREFGHSLLRAVSTLDADELEGQLGALLRSGLVKRLDDAAPEPLFCFKHALVRDAAYGTLLKSRRQATHARIAEALSRRAAAGERVRAERLAHHYTEAGLLERAIEAWLDAGREARRRSEQAEAIEHYRRVPALLDRLPRESDYPARQRRLNTLLAHAACHVALDGYSSEEARRLYEEAETLADRLGQETKVFNARLGLETYHHMRGDFERAMRLAESCRDMARRAHRLGRHRDAPDERQASVMALAKSNWAIGALLFHQGRFERSMRHLSRCLRYCDTVDPDRRAALQDPVVMCRVYRSWYDWERGRADEALRSVEETVARATDGGHAFSLGVSLAFNASIHLFRHEHEEAIERASRCMAVCERSGFRTWLAWAMIIRGRARCERAHDRRGGFADLEEGLRVWGDVGAIVTRPFAHTLLAEAYLLDDRGERALASVRDALRTVERHGERYYEAEIHRVHARALLHRDDAVAPADARARVEEAERSLERAVAFAAARGLHASVLRSTTDLARLRLEHAPGDAASARHDSADALDSALAAIDGGGNELDVRRARELLDTLRTRPLSRPIAR